MELEERNSAAVPLEPSKDPERAEDKDSKQDVTDIPPKSSKISNCDIFFLILSIVTHCTDVLVDINIVFQYYFHNKLHKLLLTIALILIPSLINTLVSLQMYQQDGENNDDESNEDTKKQSLCIKICKKIGKLFGFVLTVIFQFTMAQRCIYSLRYALKSRSCKKKDDKVGQRKYFIKMLRQEQDIALLRVLECFIEAAPQQILQLSLFVHDYHGEFSILSMHQVISIASSFISLAWAMVSYHRNVRLAQEDKKNIDFIGSVLQFLWYFFITTSRIACVSAAAVYSTTFVLAACFFHWLGMTMWTILESHGLITFCHNRNRTPHMPLAIIERVKSTLFSCVLGFVYIFIYLNPEDTSTFYRHLFFYTICFFENVSASVLLLVEKLPADIDTARYHYLLSGSCIVPFVVGIIVMIIYYMKFHPSMKHVTFHFWRLLKARHQRK